MKSYSVKEFLDKEFLQYSNYKVIQQIPCLTDTMSQTARKIIWTVSKYPNKKFKTTEIHPLIYNEVNYLHGDLSAINVWENLAAKFANGINLITAKANFGYRTEKSAAAARYASAQYSKLARLLFKDIDRNLVIEQVQEGKVIEPYFMIPILPINVINGFSGIAVGFSSSIIPRDAKFIFDLFYKILSRKIKNIPKNIPPKITYFKGRIDYGDNEKQYIFEGVIEKGKATKRFGTLIITELPPKWQRSSYNEFLDKLSDAGVVYSYTENCIKNDFYYEIKVEREIYDKPVEELINIFSLIQKQSENLTFIKYHFDNDELHKTIVEYDNIAEMLADWFQERLYFYGKRKEYILNKIENDIEMLSQKLMFIKAILDKKIIIERKKKAEIEKQLIKLKFIKINDSYDYLLRMPLYSLTEEKIKELENEVNNLLKLKEETIKKELNEMWLEDLEEIKPLIYNEYKEKLKN